MFDIISLNSSLCVVGGRTVHVYFLHTANLLEHV